MPIFSQVVKGDSAKESCEDPRRDYLQRQDTDICQQSLRMGLSNLFAEQTEKETTGNASFLTLGLGNAIKSFQQAMQVL